MAVFLYLVFTAVHIGILVWALMLYRRQASLGLGIVTVITASLVYDNAVIALGGNLGIGDTLLWLNVPRYVIHTLFTPCLVIAALEFSSRSSVYVSPRLKQAAWGATALLIVVGFAQTFIGAELKPSCYEGTIRYAERVSEWQACPNYTYAEEVFAERGAPPVASIVTILLVGAAAVAIGRKTGEWVLLVGVVVMFVGAAIPASRVGPAFGNGGEVVLMLCMVMTEAALQRRAAPKLVTVS